MDVPQLRAELTRRGLDKTGDKATLQERMIGAVTAESGAVMAASSSSADAAGGSPGPPKRRRDESAATAAGSPGGSADATAGAGSSPGLLLEQLQCPVCLETTLPPVLQCRAGHVICSDCSTNLSLPKKCPTCRVAMAAPARNLALEQLAEGLRLPCPHAQ